MTVDLCIVYMLMYVYVRVDDLNLDAMLQWLGRGNKSALSRQLSKQYALNLLHGHDIFYFSLKSVVPRL